ncbi:transposase [Nocardia amikacinitolerans]|uniref:transposase n=1 Tax=Nocardia amikacinitolerans TaxID=756689 RepID=UPI0035566818|nr:Transposase, Mutator family [Nocardia amikacinitolerans]
MSADTQEKPAEAARSTSGSDSPGPTRSTLLREGSSRPLDEVYVAVFIDAIVVKIRDGQVANRPIYAAIGVTVTGEKDILGLWAGSGG